jgi:hypothetical protein
MPKFLGLYAYKVHIGHFEGSEDDLRAQRQAETGKGDFYPGADLSAVSNALALIASESRDSQALGASQLLALTGAGQALVSGFLHLLHPDTYGFVNSPTKAPFAKSGWVEVTDGQRRKAKQVAEGQLSNAAQLSTAVFELILRWQVFLSEVRARSFSSAFITIQSSSPRTSARKLVGSIRRFAATDGNVSLWLSLVPGLGGSSSRMIRHHIRWHDGRLADSRR